MDDGRILCKRCGLRKWPRGRGLCQTCWKVAKETDFEHYPSARARDHDAALVCQCFNPIPERIPPWDADQCKRCGKKVMK